MTPRIHRMLVNLVAFIDEFTPLEDDPLFAVRSKIETIIEECHAAEASNSAALKKYAALKESHAREASERYDQYLEAIANVIPETLELTITDLELLIPLPTPTPTPTPDFGDGDR